MSSDPSFRLKRVVFAAGLNPSMKFGSLEEQAYILAREFHARGGLFLPLYLSEPGPEMAAEYQAAGLAVEALDLRHFSLTNLRRLLRLLHRNRIEVIHWNFYSPLFNGYVWALTLLTPRIEHYFTDHGSRELPLDHQEAPLKTVIKRWLFRRYHNASGVSDFIADQMRQDRIWGDPTRYHLFINTRRFQPDPRVRCEMRKRLDAENAFVILAVANLIRAKGIDVVLRALTELPDAARLWIVGDGEDAGRLHALCQELSLENRVRFLGMQHYVQPFMQAADCFVCPSVWAEAAGLVNMEALACGLPVVASHIGGIPEIVEAGKTGWLFRAGDAQHLAEQLRQLFFDPDMRRRMGQEAQVAARRFSIENALNEHLKRYRACDEWNGRR